MSWSDYGQCHRWNKSSICLKEQDHSWALSIYQENGICSVLTSVREQICYLVYENEESKLSSFMYKNDFVFAEENAHVLKVTIRREWELHWAREHFC